MRNFKTDGSGGWQIQMHRVKDFPQELRAFGFWRHCEKQLPILVINPQTGWQRMFSVLYTRVELAEGLE